MHVDSSHILLVTQEQQRQAEKASLHEQLSALQAAVADKQAARQSLQTARMHAQVGLLFS